MDLFRDAPPPKWDIVKDGPNDRDWIITRYGQWRMRGLLATLQWLLPYNKENDE